MGSIVALGWHWEFGWLGLMVVYADRNAIVSHLRIPQLRIPDRSERGITYIF